MADLREPLRVFFGGAAALVVAGSVALVARQPWLFPSLGPAVMLHLEKPRAAESSPRNTFVGHGVAHTPTQLLIAAGAIALVTAVDWSVNRATGQAMPVWAAAEPAPEGVRHG